MVDMHTHILPAFDDGAENIEESLELIDSLSNQGVTDICLTSHYYPFEMPLERFTFKRVCAYNELCNNMGNRKVKLHLGAEVQLNEIIFNNEDISALCIEGTNYMLLELPYVEKFEKSLISSLDRFIDMYGITPIIAHAERYYPVQKDPFLCAQFKECGCLIQINCDSVFERGRQKRTIKKLIKNGLCDLLGTDCHNKTTRPANMDKAVNFLKEQYGEGIINFFQENAQLVLQNQRIDF